MNTERELYMFYQTTLRNVVSFTSVSLALLGYSRFYRDKNYIYNVGFIIISLLILLNAGMICLYLIHDIENFNKQLKKESEKQYFEKWIKIPKIVLGIIVIIALFGLYTLKREFINSEIILKE